MLNSVTPNSVQCHAASRYMSNESEIGKVEERLRVAQLKGGTDELSLLLDNALSFTILDGTLVSKMDDMNLHKSPHFRIT